MIVDEGGAYNTAFGRMTAAPAIAEKGELALEVIFSCVYRIHREQ